MSDTCPTCGAEVQIVGETTKHYEPMAGTIVFTPAGKERQMMSRASSVEDRIAEIREYVEREKRGEVASDRYSAARLLDATVYLLERVEELEGVLESLSRKDYEVLCRRFGTNHGAGRIGGLHELADLLRRARQALDTGEDDADRR